jgi:hypothetical protein
MLRSEKGQALPLAMMALAFGALVIAPFLGHAGTSLISSRVYSDIIKHQASCDAGIEHAIWNLTRGDLTEQIPESGDSVTYQLAETLNNLTTTVTVTANITDEGGIIGEIDDAVLDTLEFDTSYGLMPSIIQVSNDIYAIAYQGSNGGYLRTVEIDTDGEITNYVLDSLVFDYNISYPDIIQVSTDVYAIAYQGSGNDGYTITVEIADNGSIGNYPIDSLEFDTGNGREPDIIHVSGNIYAIAYRGNNNDGYITTVKIIDNGNITNSIVDQLEYDTSNGYFPDITHISGEVYAIAYRGNSGDGYLATIEIADNGHIDSSVIDRLEFDTSNCYYPNIINVSGDVYAIVYQGNGNDGYLNTIEITDNGDINNWVTDQLEFDTSNGREPVIIPVSSTVYAIAYRGPGNDGFITTVEIAPDGYITDSLIDSLEYDTSSGITPSIVQVSEGVFAIAYRGPGNDGFLKTIAINTDAPTAGEYEIVATTGEKTINAYININDVTVSIVSWQVE